MTCYQHEAIIPYYFPPYLDNLHIKVYNYTKQAQFRNAQTSLFHTFFLFSTTIKAVLFLINNKNYFN